MDITNRAPKVVQEKTKAPHAFCSLLVIIIDTNPSQTILRRNPDNLTKIVDAVIVLANAHILQNSANMVAVLSCHHHRTDYLYPMNKPLYERSTDGQLEAFFILEKSVKIRLTEVICSAPKISVTTESMLAGSIGMALCYIKRMRKNVYNDFAFKSRILVVTGGSECASQYMSYMNIFFAAQRGGVVLDVCNLGRPMTLLQQGCDLTQGQYLNLRQLDGFLEFLLWVFLPDPEMRKKLVLPPKVPVDYRAACFCHRDLIDQGYVCSICLSIYCKYILTCTTCGAIFKPKEDVPPIYAIIRKKSSDSELVTSD